MPYTNYHEDNIEKKSSISNQSSRSRSSVMERARAYEQRRGKSVERASDQNPSKPGNNNKRAGSAGRSQGNRASTHERAMASVQQEQYRMAKDSGIAINDNNSDKNRRQNIEYKQEIQNNNNEQQAIVSPELLVDALSGHEDGLLAIAERLMEHYDAGYDIMGEAIIDAFADVQKLFQHVVEAAHMEGAAFESSRREAEMAELRKQAGNVDVTVPTDNVVDTQSGSRHDEFVDQDVKDVLSEAIRKGAALRDANSHTECLRLYENACQSASSLLPVDSDHRGRLQLSVARSESMSPDRACAILRYAMDDVLRSGLRAGKAGLPDVSKRSDMVLSKPKSQHSINSGGRGQHGVVQSSEEALASLVEEMKEIMSAPVYNNTPLQSVAERFWGALEEAQRTQQKNEERLEQSLGKLKGEFLMAKAEWEEKLTASQEQASRLKKQWLQQKEALSNEVHNIQSSNNWENDRRETGENINPSDPGGFQFKNRSAPGSVASLGSGIAQSARSLVGSFNCTGINERSGPLVESELQNEANSIRKNRSSDSFVAKTNSFSSRDNRPPSQPRRGRGRPSTQGGYR